MGEEEKRPEEGKKEANEEAKKEVASGEEAETPLPPQPPPPPPPEEVVMRVYMHCGGCAREVQRCLKVFEGVDEVRTDCRAHKVVVKGRKAAEDPMKMVERLQKKIGRKVELLTPLPPPKPEPKPEEKKEEEKPKPEEKKIEEPPVIAVVLKVRMHCEPCAQEIKKRILKMKGVQEVEPELKASQVTVKGVFEAAKLVEYVYKRTGKHAAVVKQEPVEKKPEGEVEKGKDEKNKDKAEGDVGEQEKGGGEKVEEGGSPDAIATAGDGGKVEVRNYYYYPRYGAEYTYQAYPPQIFSDENPNACAVM